MNNITPEQVKEMYGENLCQKILFSIEKSKSKDLQQTGSNGRSIHIDIEGGDTIILSRIVSTTSKLACQTVENMLASMNHFICWTQLHGYTKYLDNFKMLIYRLDKQLNCIAVNDYVAKRVTELAGTKNANNQYCTHEYFLHFVNNNIMNDSLLLESVNDYIKDITMYNFESSNIESKLEECDIHICHVLSWYIKLIYLCFYKVNTNYNFIKLIKPLIVDLSIKTNDYAMQNIFPIKYEYMRTSFIDRLYTFVEFATDPEFKTHSGNIGLYSCIGLNEQVLIDSVMSEIYDALKRVKVETYIPNGKKKSEDDDVFDNIYDFFQYGFVSKATSAYIQMAKKKHVTNQVGVHNLNFILRKYSITTHGDETTAEANRYEVYLERKNQEWYKEYKEIYNHILTDIRKKIVFPETIEVILRQNGRYETLLNKFMVSLFLDIEYKCDISDILNMRDYVTICVHIHERLNKYSKLKNAVIGEIASGKNSVVISPEDIDNFYNAVNSKMSLKLITEMCSAEYNIIHDGPNGLATVSSRYNIQNDLLAFINNGCVFE